jgi:hypothetical protein
MDGTILTARRGEVEADLFRAIRFVVFLMESEGQCHGGTWRDDQGTGRGESCVGTRETSAPERRSSEARAFQGQGFVISCLVTLVMIPDDEQILDRERPGIWICDGQRHRVVPG